MKIFTSILSLLLFLHLLLLLAAAYNLTDYVLLNCGSTTTTSDHDGRIWAAETILKTPPPDISSTSDASDFLETGVPYTCARIFHSPFTYSIPISAAGPKFLRLYFNPSTYSGNLQSNNSFFSVTVGDHTLLRNFSAFLAVSASTEHTLIKEFIVTVRDTEVLNITFFPSPNSFAFVNGIEVFSIPENHYIRGNDHAATLVNSVYTPFYIDNNTALERTHRLNVGGNYITGKSDSGMFRQWFKDDDYIFNQSFGVTPANSNISIRYTPVTPNYTAPEIVYNTARFIAYLGPHYNLTWRFNVDSGFYYLLRLHFCEIVKEMAHVNGRVFTILINNQTAEKELDVFIQSHGLGIPLFKDYVVRVDDPDGRRSKQNLWLSLHPLLYANYGDALLNGLEIFKLNDSDGSLAGPNPEGPSSPQNTGPTARNESKRSPPWGVIAGGVAGGVVVLLIALGFLIVRRRRVKELRPSDDKTSWVLLQDPSKSTNPNGSSLPSNICRRFSLAEIKTATGEFDENFVVGTGGFGNVYRGFIDDGAIAVAIKRLNPSSKQGAREFETEILMLSKLRHVHLVSLIGYCDEDGEMILVYDYMSRGTLRDHLYKTDNPPLRWTQRLQICVGAARGLNYLHTGAQRTIIHRDVKSTNILLDEKWVAKISDFGLSKLGPAGGDHSHVSTVVKGSYGYLDPEYFRRQQLTEKSDVYSFGVVLFEVLCGRAALNQNLPKEQVNLAEWARHRYRKGIVDQIVDPNLTGQIALECLSKFAEIANSCLRDKGVDRPAMNDVVWGLEFALQLQEAAEKDNRVMGAGGGLLSSPYASLLKCHEEPSSSSSGDGVGFFGSSKHMSSSKTSNTSTSTHTNDGCKDQVVFSEIMNPTGR